MSAKFTLAAVLSATAALSTGGAAMAVDLDALYAAAKQEGQLDIFAARDWCNYGGLEDAFAAKYPGIKINAIAGPSGSADQLAALKAAPGPQAPDTIDVGIGYGPQAKAAGLVQAYKPTGWDKIPTTAKDPDGFWYTGYYGLVAFMINDDLVTDPPKTWADLGKDGAPLFALTGDPHKDDGAILGVWAAGLAASNGDQTKAADNGLAFFKALNDKGFFVPVNAGQDTIASGQAGVIAGWDFNLYAWKAALKDNPKTEIVVPGDAVVAGVYVQAISAHAPHPNAAKLWEEFIYSDAGQSQWLAGYCHPILMNDMVTRKVIASDALAKLPDASLDAKAVFPSADQQAAASNEIASKWDSTVGVSVQK